MKKIFFAFFLLLSLAGIYAIWNVFGPTVTVPDETFFYIKTGSSYEEVQNELIKNKIVGNPFFFNLVARRVSYHRNIKYGKYEIKKGSILSLIRILKSGKQTPVRLVINKIRTKEDFAGKIGRAFESDSTDMIAFITNNDSLKQFKLDSNNFLTTVIPNSYLFWWNSSVSNIVERLSDQKEKFWEGKRAEKAALLNLTPEQVYALASLVEEETNKQEDKGLIASVYLNRLKKGMKLEADPTVKYAMRDFGLRRILNKHLQFPSPYNTYRQTGLPPGPICTPSISSIDAVLDAPKTNYIFFVAKPSFNGYSNFAETYSQHLVYANAYRKALDSLIESRKSK